MASSFPVIVDRNGVSRLLNYAQTDPLNQVIEFFVSNKQPETTPRKEIVDDYFNSAKDFPEHCSCIVSDPTCGQQVRYSDYVEKTPTIEKKTDDTDSDISYDSDDSCDSDSSRSKRKRRNLKIRILKKLKSMEKKSEMYHEELKALLEIKKRRENNGQRRDILQGLLNAIRYEQ